MTAQNTNENGLGDTAEITETKPAYVPTAQDLQDLKDEETRMIEMREIDRHLGELYDAFLETDKASDPEAYCAAKDKLARTLEDGLRGEEDTILYLGISPIWHDDVAVSGPLSYRLEKGIAGWDLLVQKNEVIADDYIIAMIDEEFSLPAARVWAESVIEISKRESRPVEQEPAPASCDHDDKARVAEELAEGIVADMETEDETIRRSRGQLSEWGEATKIEVDGVDYRALEIENLAGEKFALFDEAGVWTLAELVSFGDGLEVWEGIERLGCGDGISLAEAKVLAEETIRGLAI